MSEAADLPYDFAWMQKIRAKDERIANLTEGTQCLVELLNEANGRCERYRDRLGSAQQEISDLREKLRISEENRKLLAVGAFVNEGLVQATVRSDEPRCDHHTKEQA